MCQRCIVFILRILSLFDDLLTLITGDCVAHFLDDTKLLRALLESVCNLRRCLTGNPVYNLALRLAYDHLGHLMLLNMVLWVVL